MKEHLTNIVSECNTNDVAAKVENNHTITRFIALEETPPN